MSAPAKKRFLCNLCFKFVFGETEFQNHKRDVHNEVDDDDESESESDQSEQEQEIQQVPSVAATATAGRTSPSPNETEETDKSPAPKLMLGRTPNSNKTPPASRRGRKPASTKIAAIIKTEVTGKQSKISDFFGRGKDTVVTLDSDGDDDEEPGSSAKKRPADQIEDDQMETGCDAEENDHEEVHLEKKLKLDPDVIKVEIPVETINDDDDDDNSEEEIGEDVKPKIPKEEEDSEEDEKEEVDWLSLLTDEEMKDSFRFYPAKQGYPENILEKAFMAYVSVSPCATPPSAKKLDRISVHSGSERVSNMSDIDEEEEGDNEGTRSKDRDDEEKIDEAGEESEKDEGSEQGEESEKEEGSEQGEESEKEDGSEQDEEPEKNEGSESEQDEESDEEKESKNKNAVATSSNQEHAKSKKSSDGEDDSEEEEEYGSASAQSSDSEIASNPKGKKAPLSRKAGPRQTRQKLSQLRVVARTGRGRGRGRRSKP